MGDYMKWLRQRVLKGDILFGVWLNLGSAISAEMAGRSGFDWVLLDLEHGYGDASDLVHQLQALESTPAVPIVRVCYNQSAQFKRPLDLGASGIMVPDIRNADDARAAVKAMRYPPAGNRGLSTSSRAAGFGAESENYFKKANKELLTIVQIETKEAVAHAAEIAGVEGVDVLFIGPSDLCADLGVPKQFDQPKFQDALKKVATACRAKGKSAGVLLKGPEQVKQMITAGFTFVALGSDGGTLFSGLRRLAGDFTALKGLKNIRKI